MLILDRILRSLHPSAMETDIIYSVAVWLVPLVIAIVFHEVAHGLVARRLGDTTAERKGRLTLNPVKHIDPFGTVILPMLLAISHRRPSAGRSRFRSTTRAFATRAAIWFWSRSRVRG